MIQEYPGDEDYVAHFYNILPALKDKRYITVDGKCLFMIYDPIALPDVKHFMDLWRIAFAKFFKGNRAGCF